MGNYYKAVRKKDIIYIFLMKVSLIIGFIIFSNIYQQLIYRISSII